MTDDAETLAEAKDEVGRVAGRRLLRAGRERRLIYAMIVYSLVTTVSMVYLVILYTRVHNLTITVKNAQTSGHVSRLADQARTDAEVRALACFFVEGVPDTVGGGRAGQFRRLYGCAPYTGPGAKPAPTPTKTIVLPGVPGPTTTLTENHSVPGPTVTRTRVKTVPVPKPCIHVGKVCITLPVAQG